MYFHFISALVGHSDVLLDKLREKLCLVSPYQVLAKNITDDLAGLDPDPVAAVILKDLRDVIAV